MIYRKMLLLLALLLVVTIIPTRTLPPLAAPLAHAALSGSDFVRTAFDLKSTSAIATGDVNGDGYLDLVLGSDEHPSPSQLYLNNRSTNPFASVAPTAIGSGANTAAVALGDLNDDGRLDLVLGNGGEPSQLYLNSGGTDPFADVAPTAIGSGLAVALGDLNSDGRLDLVLGNGGEPSQLYLNSGGTDPFAGVTPTDIYSGAYTVAVALGDVNGDSHLDLVLGKSGQPSQLYLNSGGTDPFAGVTPTDIGGTYTIAVALGDVNGDNRLDLVLGNTTQPSQLYLNNGGIDPFADVAPTAIGSGAATVAVALGDVNGDDRLDLVLGNGAQPSQLYLNSGETNPFVGVTPTEIGETYTMAVALGDVNSDSRPDLVLGNIIQPSHLYLNKGGMEPFKAVTPAAIGGEAYASLAVALGDLNGDGRLDLVLGNSTKPSQLYLNSGTTEPFSGVSVTEIGNGAYTTSVALGDVNGDGRLDLVLGNSTQPSQLYLNSRTANPFDRVDPIDIGGGAYTSSVALGDVNGDGRLDLVLGNYDEPSQLYLNNRTATPFDRVDPIPIGGGASTMAVALGDVNGDGRLDLALGNLGSNRLYLNSGGANPFAGITPIAIESEGITTSVALGDMNGDSRLDLVLGNDFEPSELYLNNGATDPFGAVIPTTIGSGAYTRAVALGDLDGDGHLDLVLGNDDQPSQFYLNNGTATPFAGITPSAIDSRATTRAVAFGDVNGDGRLDLVLGNNRGPSQLYIQPAPMSHLPNNPPSVSVRRLGAQDNPVGTDSAGFFSAGQIISNTQVVSIPFSLSDPEGDPANVRAEYSLDGGGRWLPAVPAAGATITDLPTPYRDYLFPWDLQASEVFGQSDNVVVRLIASPSYKPRPNQVAGSFPYSAVAATTFPFRVRGTVAQVREGGQPVSGALVYRLPSQMLRDAPVLTNWQTGTPLRSNAQGFVSSRDPLRPGDRLVAMREVTRTNQFTLYATSARPTPQGLEMMVVEGFGDQPLEIVPTQRLLLFPLTISLEWDSRAEQAYMARLKADLRRASELLYTWTGGQAALGDIMIAHAKERWAEADVQIYASNRVRPNADQGGIVTAPISETVTLADQTRHTLRYSPGQVRMGVSWNRYGSSSGVLGEDWPRALAHELGHYLFFLDDSYLGFDEAGRLISIDDNACEGAMHNPYRSDFDSFRPTSDWLPACENTLPNRTSGRSDWATINRFYRFEPSEPMLQEPSGFNSPAGPRTLPLAMTQFQEVSPSTPQPLGTQLVTLTGPDNVRYQPGDRAQAVLFQDDRTRLTELGRPTADLIELRGGREGDEICVFDPSGRVLDQPAGRYEGCATVSPENTVVTMQPSGATTRQASISWPPDLRITPVNTTTLRVEARGLEPGLTNFSLRHYPALYTASELVEMEEDDAKPGVYRATITASPNEPLQNGYVLVRFEGTVSSRETIMAYGRGGSPARQGRGSLAPVLSPDGQVIVHSDVELSPDKFYILHTTETAPAPPAWGLPVGPAYVIALSDALAADEEAQEQLASTSLNFSYFDDDIARDLEPGLTLAFFNPATSSWKLLDTRRDAERNEASALWQGPGVYQLMATAALPLARAGWNLIAFYPGATLPPTTAFGALAGKYRSVYGYEKGDWKLYTPRAPGWVNDLSTLTYGESYWIDAIEATTVPVRPQLQADVGVLALPPATYYGLLPSGVSPGQPVSARVAGQVCGTATTKTVTGGVAFVVDVLSEGSRAGCGLPGHAVTITVGARTFTTTWASGPYALTDEYRIYLPLVRR